LADQKSLPERKHQNLGRESRAFPLLLICFLTTPKLSIVDSQALTKTRQQKSLTKSCYSPDKVVVIAQLTSCQLVTYRQRCFHSRLPLYAEGRFSPRCSPSFRVRRCVSVLVRSLPRCSQKTVKAEWGTGHRASSGSVGPYRTLSDFELNFELILGKAG
jgi:hypothetical protein